MPGAPTKMVRRFVEVALLVTVIVGAMSSPTRAVRADDPPVPRDPLPVELDRDRDGLSDEEEAFYQTDPDNPDTDGDGLLDGWEVHGVTRNGIHEPLGEYGADPHFPDVFVEIDWMATEEGDRRANAAIAYRAAVDVWRTFRASGRGIRIHFDLGPAIEEQIPAEWIEDDAPDFSRFAMTTDERKVLPYRDRFPRRPACGTATISTGSLYG
ncbi:MAG TPA: hypothetical protein VK116_16275, partial [Planctomycetota bacterium]|nr:hypothetical protein [Planctomycetota bacterium]